MSRFFNKELSRLEAYVPGEQPQNRAYIKLNTNESPYPPSDGVAAVLNSAELQNLRLYSDPDGRRLRVKLAEHYGVMPENVILGNGSDEILSFCFQAFKNNSCGFVFPNITYGFYPVFCNLYGASYEELPLSQTLEINVDDYVGINKNIVIANPNAPSGVFLPLSEIERIVSSNPDNVVIIDEAYIDFGGKSAKELTKSYSNLVVVQTYSKSRSMAGARLGYAIANRELISDLERVRCSTNPYNINRLTLTAGEAVLKEQKYYDERCAEIIKTREYVKCGLKELGFSFPNSAANFIFARKDGISGADMYKQLKEKGILVRHFSKPEISDYLRITIGTRDEMECFLNALKEIIMR